MRYFCCEKAAFCKYLGLHLDFAFEKILDCGGLGMSFEKSRLFLDRKIWQSAHLRCSRLGLDRNQTITNICEFGLDPGSSEISDLLLFISYFASQNKGIKFGNYFFDMCCVN